MGLKTASVQSNESFHNLFMVYPKNFSCNSVYGIGVSRNLEESVLGYIHIHKW